MLRKDSPSQSSRGYTPTAAQIQNLEHGEFDHENNYFAKDEEDRRDEDEEE